MRLGIRTKLIVLLITVALLPLLVALGAIVVGGEQLRSEILGQGIQSIVLSEARVMQTELEKDIQLFEVALQERAVLYHLKSITECRSQKELDDLDRRWPMLNVDAADFRKVVVNATASVLKRLMQEEPQIGEVLVTDRFGQLIAATQRTTDFFQGDEDWWRETYNNGKGQIYIPGVHFDQSAEMWVIDLCIPIIAEGRVFGIAKASLDIKKWMPDCEQGLGKLTGYFRLIGQDGTVFHGHKISEKKSEPMNERQEGWELMAGVEAEGGWTRLPDDTLAAFARVQLPEELGDTPVFMKPWILAMVVPVKEVKAEMFRVSLVVLAVGGACIGLLFVGGLVLIDRSLTRRIQRLSRSARQVAKGNLQHRADATWGGTRMTGRDEIDELARDFNNMVRRLQRSYDDLHEANRLKEDFIRIAGHELRTPVSYIVALSSMMKQVHDPDRLQKAMDTMGFKASRLNEIIQSMFKLIPEQTLRERLNYEPIKLNDLFEKVAFDLQPWIERRRQSLEIDCGEGDTLIQADMAKLIDIVENLAMNAIKFTPDGGVIKIRARRQLGGYVQIDVVDEGPGIPPSDRPHIFEPFYSGSDVLRHSTGKSGYGKKGMGLGLPIVKHFIELHGGTIMFTTGAEGTTFTIRIPLTPPEGVGESSAG